MIFNSNTSKKLLTMSSLSQLSNDELRLILPHLPSGDLTQLCQSNKRLTLLCSEYIRQKQKQLDIQYNLPEWSWAYLEELNDQAYIGCIPVYLVDKKYKPKYIFDLFALEPSEEYSETQQFNFFLQNAKIKLLDLLSKYQPQFWETYYSCFEDDSPREKYHYEDYDPTENGYISDEIKTRDDLIKSINESLLSFKDELPNYIVISLSSADDNDNNNDDNSNDSDNDDE